MGSYERVELKLCSAASLFSYSLFCFTCGLCDNLSFDVSVLKCAHMGVSARQD